MILAYFTSWALLIEGALCSHFRGGTASWKYNSGLNEIEITRRTFWKSSSVCYGDDSNFYYNLCTGTCNLQKDLHSCTDQSAILSFTTGERKLSYQTSSRLVVRYSDCCWTDDSDWDLKIDANTTTNTKTGTVNTSPVSLLFPIIRIQSGCGQGTINIPVADADGDVVKCRWALSNNQECGTACNRLPSNTLDSLQCILNVNSVGVGTYIAALQIEDFRPINSSNIPYTSIPLQFSINVYNSPQPCRELPSVLSGLSDRSVVFIEAKCKWTQAIIAKSTALRISEIVTASPPGLSLSGLTQFDNSFLSYTYASWTPDSTQLGPHIFCYAAVDSLGRMSAVECLVLSVTRDECEHSDCAQVCSTCNRESYICSCNTGYTLDAGGRACNDNNECVLGTSGCTQLCNNTIGSYTCSCNTGYTLHTDSRTCKDINECVLGTSGCIQLCNNTVGSYKCSCNTGYTLDAGNHTCNDINECVLGTSGCAQLCNNTIGSYTCACNTGYTLVADNHTCNDINECLLGTSGCTQLCNNTAGSYICSCNTGYALDLNNHTCNDINECVLGTSACTQLCNNTVGSYTCSCNTGYTLDADNRTCNDINECVLGTSGCTQLCKNTIGSYTCYCNTGYILDADNHTCNDINECLLGTSGCAQFCNNTVGSYTCSCSIGYTLDLNNHTCNDINECMLGTRGCTQLCNNTVGSYTCSCNTGYTLDADNHTCNDINECVLGTSGCIQLCNNTVGSYTCYCNTGYTLALNNHVCNDVDECVLGTSGCTQLCNNTVGSYTCSCNTGYKLGGDNHTCSDINECSNSEACSLQVCTNTNGSYICACSPEFILSADMKTCKAYPATLNAVAVTIAGSTVDFFKQTKFISTVQDVLEVYCISKRCSRWAINAQYIVTIRSITNIAVGILAILQVQTFNTVLSATVVTQMLTESNKTLAMDGFIIVSVAPYSEPASKLSLEGTVAGTVVPIVIVSVIAAVVFVLLFMCCCKNSGRNNSETINYNVTPAEGMTMKKLEHMVVDNEYATKLDDQFGDVRSVHLAFQETHRSSANETSTSSDTNKDTTQHSDVTVL